jgi:hypothetical protein
VPTTLEAGGDSPAVKLGSTNDNNPVMAGGVVGSDLIRDIERHRARAEYSQNLEGHDSRVGDAPAVVCRGVLAPCGRALALDGSARHNIHYRDCNGTRTDLSHRTSARVDGATEGRIIQEAGLENEVDEAIKRLGGEPALSGNAYS